VINTILFDLDGTLLKITQETFITNYFGKLKKVFERLEMNPDLSVKAVWAGTKAMVENDGTVLNHRRFWDTFTGFLNLDDEKRSVVERNCDAFYTNEFNTVKEVMEPTDIPSRLIPALAAKGYTVALATNPLFPACAVTTRLDWIGLTPHDFSYITHYANSKYCKPNLEYFREVLGKLNKQPGECIMVGNNVDEDMCAGRLGMETFLITDCLENESGTKIEAYKHGTQAELEAYLMSLPDLM